VKRLLALALSLASLSLAASGSAQASATSTTFSIDQFSWVCGEPIELVGTLHEVFATVENPAGGVLVTRSINPQGVTGTGLDSGVTYQGTGVTRIVSTVALGTTTTFVDNFRLISHTSLEDVIVQEVSHLTVDANGDVTASFDRVEVLCR
jgi:hypothetical protein